MRASAGARNQHDLSATTLVARARRGDKPTIEPHKLFLDNLRLRAAFGTAQARWRWESGSLTFRESESTVRRVISCIVVLAGLVLAILLLAIGSARHQDLASIDAVWADRNEKWSTQVTIADPSPAKTSSTLVVEPQPPRTSPLPEVVVTNHQVPRSQAAPIPSDRVTLVRELQRELIRVGCYSGPLNGVWTTSTRTAMKSFIDRANAILPVEEPDAILLNLVRSHQGQGCRSCPAGQSLAKSGRCLPVAIAHTGKGGAPEPAPAISGWRTSTTHAAPTPPHPGDRMALAGPESQAVAGETPPAAAAPATKNASAGRAYERRGSLTPTYSRRSFVESIFGSRNNNY
jgi:hypothetical protein